jgi:outer membrane protein OmpA-like peptidoglycan-associated protein/tetratricopeptide (TPR) repeat protein
MIKYISICLLILVFNVSVFSQNVEFKSANFKNDKDGFKEAVNNIKTGDGFLEAGMELVFLQQNPKRNFLDALDKYLPANTFNPNNAELNYKIGKAYLHTANKYEALIFLEKAIKLDSDLEPMAYYWLGVSYQYHYKFVEAKDKFEICEDRMKDNKFDEIKKNVRKNIKACDEAIKMIENPERVWVDNIKIANTQYPDYCPAISVDESMMIFNSKRNGAMADDGNFFSDIYVSYKQNNSWSKPVALGAPLNSDSQDECLALSPDGQSMFVYKEVNGNGDIYQSFLDGEDWSEPVKLQEGKINTDDNESHASFSHDGIKIYYVTDFEYGNKGGKDIYFSGAMSRHKESWGKGMTISRTINTIYDEGSIYMHPDGKTIYFSSKGHNSIGGYDIFKSERVGNGWSAPVNMGYPINTPYDENYFVMSASGRHAYLSSDRENGEGDADIYMITFLGPEKPTTIDTEDHLLASFVNPIKEANIEGPVEVESKNLTVLKGRILDDFTDKPVEAEIEIVDNVKNEVISSFKSNSSTGKFLISLPSGINYGIAVKAEDYLFHSENFNLPEMADYQLVEKDIRLKNVCIGCKIVLNNIFFDTGKSNLRPESTNELTRLLKLMNDIPKLRIEISGHTDNVGSKKSNEQLSERRAKAVVDYLISKGVSASRLEYKGYGDTQPVSPNDTPQGRQQNRRTEFKVLNN